VKKIARSFRRIVTLRAEVDLPAYQVPFAFVVAVAYYVTLAAGQTFSVCMNGIPDVFRARWVESF
jgi:hypothetical protein